MDGAGLGAERRPDRILRVGSVSPLAGSPRGLEKLTVHERSPNRTGPIPAGFLAVSSGSIFLRYRPQRNVEIGV
jgi:hypothetical protein